MLLESLPAELWFEIFKCCNVDELLHSYYGLNSHFRSLLWNYFRQYIVNLESISKTNLTIFHEHYLPSLFNQIRVLRLYNDDNSPQQIDRFLSQNLTLDRFTCLQSLSLSHIGSIGILYDMIIRLRHLQDFTRLIINNFTFLGNEKSILQLINSIWSLPKLSYLHLDIANEHQHYFPVPQMYSSSLKHVELINCCCPQRFLSYLFNRTPFLQRLGVNVVESVPKQQLLYTSHSMKKLHISYDGFWSNLTNLLQTLPNLTHLLLNAVLKISVDGHVLEKFIIDYLPNLKLFRFVIQYLIIGTVDISQQSIRLLDTFRNSFCLKNHNLCIRCDWQPRTPRNGIILYTLPYMSNSFYNCDSNVSIQSRTICPHDPSYHSYDCVTLLDYDEFPKETIEQLPICFRNVHHLTLKVTSDYQFQKIIPQLNQLIYLQVNIPNSDMHIQLQTLLDQATKLSILHFIQWPLANADTLLQHLRSTTVRQLDLTGISPTGIPQYFNKNQCEMLSRTPLGLQCQVLLVTVRERSSVLDLVQNMTNLRVLFVKCRDDPWEGSLPVNDECIEWLRSQLPSMCSLSREPRLYGKIRVWIQ